MFELVQYHLSKWHGIVLSNQRSPVDHSLRDKSIQKTVAKYILFAQKIDVVK